MKRMVLLLGVGVFVTTLLLSFAWTSPSRTYDIPCPDGALASCAAVRVTVERTTEKWKRRPTCVLVGGVWYCG